MRHDSRLHVFHASIAAVAVRAPKTAMRAVVRAAWLHYQEISGAA